MLDTDRVDLALLKLVFKRPFTNFWISFELMSLKKKPIQYEKSKIFSCFDVRMELFSND